MNELKVPKEEVLKHIEEFEQAVNMTIDQMMNRMIEDGKLALSEKLEVDVIEDKVDKYNKLEELLKGKI